MEKRYSRERRWIKSARSFHFSFSFFFSFIMSCIVGALWSWISRANCEHTGGAFQGAITMWRSIFLVVMGGGSVGRCF